MHSSLSRGPLQATPVSGALFPGAAVIGTAVSAAKHKRCNKHISRAAPFDINELYVSNSTDVTPYVGPIKAVRLKGGRGLETSKTLQAGETLLVSTPLALVTHSAAAAAETAPAAADGDDNDPNSQYQPSDEDIDQLADQLLHSTSPRTVGWLRYLDDGNIDSGTAEKIPDLAELARNSSSGSSSSNGSSSSDIGSPAAAAALDEDLLLDLIDMHTQVLIEDDALVMLRSGTNTSEYVTLENNMTSNMLDPDPQTLVGIWPELTLIPHSCCPNATIVAANSAAVITASRNIPKEGVIFQNVLGPLVLAPLKERQAAVEKTTGLKCTCPRCRDEAKQDSNLLQLIDDVYEACTQQISPELESAVENDDDQTLNSLCEQLSAYCEVVDAGFSKLAVKQQTQIWLQASLFKLYELAAIASAATGDADARSMELLAALAAEVCPGSSEHLFWAQQYRSLLASDEDSYYDGALRQAETLVMNAYKSRYGNISRALYQKMQEKQRQREEAAAAAGDYGEQ